MQQLTLKNTTTQILKQTKKIIITRKNSETSNGLKPQNPGLIETLKYSDPTHSIR
jgi:hypothetical protein